MNNPPDCISHLPSEQDSLVRPTLADNKKIPIATLRILAQDSDDEVRKYALERLERLQHTTDKQSHPKERLKGRSSLSRRALLALSFLVILYLGSAMAFREYRMNPKNRYYGFYLPSATPTTSYSKEESDKIWHALLREPTILERLYAPAEAFFRATGL